MPSYDFVAGDAFRKSLQADQRELDACLGDVTAYKAAVVLAGSIVEAMLSDALAGTAHKFKNGKPLLEQDLGGLISAARAEKILTPATSDMCSGVRQYRNLIHPGRSIRESASVNRHNAEMGRALVEIVAEELALRRRETYGLTAEQILSKLRSDTSSLAILPDLLRSSNEEECRRLLLDVLPAAYVELHSDIWSDPHLRETLSKAYRAVLNFVPENDKRLAARQFVAVLKGEPRGTVQAHETGMFRARDLALLEVEDQVTAKRYLISELTENPTHALLSALRGIGPFLNRQDAIQYVQGAMRYATSAPESDEMAERRRFVVSLFEELYPTTPAEADDGLRAQIEAWIRYFEEQRELGWLAWARTLRSVVGGPEPVEEVDVDDLPF